MTPLRPSRCRPHPRARPRPHPAPPRRAARAPAQRPPRALPRARPRPRPLAADDVAGTWTLTSGSQAGYRVREQLANLPAESDAVGRTDQVTGSITLETSGATTNLTAGTITVDTTSITSDESRRDNRLRREGLETDAFPTAEFKVTAPVEIPAAAIAGTATPVTLTGDLTLHGVTKSVQIPAQAQLADGNDPGRGLDHLPAVRLRHHRSERRRLHRLDRRGRYARVPGDVRPELTTGPPRTWCRRPRDRARRGSMPARPASVPGSRPSQD